MRTIKFMKHKKLSLMHYLTMNISGLDGDSLADGALGCTTSTVGVSFDGVELLDPISIIQKHKQKKFHNYTIFNSTHDTYDTGDLSILDR
jgi:hypothetical protein